MSVMEGLIVSGEICVVVLGSAGDIIECRSQRNRVVDAGLAVIAARLVGNVVTPMGFVGLGTGTLPPAAGQEALQQALGPRIGANADLEISPAPGAIFTAVVAAGQNTGLIAEAGIFNAAEAGEMLCRTVFDTAIAKQPDEALVIRWVLRFSAAD